MKSSRIVFSLAGIAPAEAIEHQTHVSQMRRIAETKLRSASNGSTPRSSVAVLSISSLDQVVGAEVDPPEFLPDSVDGAAPNGLLAGRASRS